MCAPLRSGTSFRNSVSTKPAKATGTAARKTASIDFEKASITPVRISGGRCRITWGCSSGWSGETPFPRPPGKQIAQVRRQPVGEDRAEGRDAERAAHRPDERGGSGGGAHVARLDRVLDGQRSSPAWSRRDRRPAAPCRPTRSAGRGRPHRVEQVAGDGHREHPARSGRSCSGRCG